MDAVTYSARQLFDDLAERLELRRIAGKQGEFRCFDRDKKSARRPSLAGYLNLIYPNKLQIIGSNELLYLDELDARQRWKHIQKMVAQNPVALIITANQGVPDDLQDAAEESQTPLWLSRQHGHQLLTYLQFYLTRKLAPRSVLHGVFMEVYSLGVLFTGDAGSGKSELALELISRGHRLIADDATEFARIGPDVIDGSCPHMLRDLLEVRGVGVLNIREMFGHTAIQTSKYLRLVIDLKPMSSNREDDAFKRLTGDIGTYSVLDVSIPKITIPVAPGRNLAVLVEAAVRNYMLKSAGSDPAQTLIERHARALKYPSPW